MAAPIAAAHHPCQSPWPTSDTDTAAARSARPGAKISSGRVARRRSTSPSTASARTGADGAELGPDLKRAVVRMTDDEQRREGRVDAARPGASRERRAGREAGAAPRLLRHGGAEAPPDVDPRLRARSPELLVRGRRHRALHELARDRRERHRRDDAGRGNGERRLASPARDEISRRPDDEPERRRAAVGGDDRCGGDDRDRGGEPAPALRGKPPEQRRREHEQRQRRAIVDEGVPAHPERAAERHDAPELVEHEHAGGDDGRGKDREQKAGRAPGERQRQRQDA